tara:strand:+ start:644 stop:970 length:327 start_codon:yes stop_codon:yes gene_type:complete
MSSIAILIPTEGDPSYVSITDYKDLNKHAGCSCGTTVSHPSVECYAWVDDEGLLVNKVWNPSLSGIMECSSTLVGNGIICCSDASGDNVDVNKETVDMVEKFTGKQIV